MTVRRLVATKGKAVTRLGLSVAHSLGHAVITNPEVLQFVKKYPRVFRFLHRRLIVGNFAGLPLTVLTVAFVYTFSLFFGLVESFVTSGQIVAIDIRLANLLYAFRNSHLIRLFLWISPFGKWQNVIIFAGVVSLLWWMRHRRDYIGALWLSIGGSQAVTFLGKLSLHRPRPAGPLPVYIESSFSFPSGHAALAAALYGFIMYSLMRSRLTWGKKVTVLFAGLLVVGAIGFSRLYLGVHYLSDVLSGYLVGLLWLIVGISLVEWKRVRSHSPARPVPFSRPERWVTYFLITITLVWYGVVTWRDIPPLATIEAVPQPSTVVDKGNVVDFFTTNSWPRFTETLAGNAQEPLSFIIIASDDQEFRQAFAKAGWYVADSVNFTSFRKIVRAALEKQSYPTAPMTPSFWRSEVHDFGLEKPTNMNLVSERHHARFWRTTLRTTDGQAVYVGTASYDVALKWFVIHRIKPDIDTERDGLLQDLRAAGVVVADHQQTFVAPTLGTNFSGDEFFTDGKTNVVEVGL